MKSKKPKAGTHEDSIRVSQGAYQKALLKSVFVNLLLALMGLVLVYLCFAATLARVVPSSAGFVPLKNNTYAGGVLPEKAQVLVVLGEAQVKTGLVDRLQQSFIPQKPSAIVSVAAGPVAEEVQWNKGVLTVDGKPMPAPITQDPGLEYLSGEYIAVCVRGDCTPGTLVFFTPKQILGVPFNQTAEVPPPPALDANASGVDRGNPEEVVRASVMAGYYGDDDLACSLYTEEYLVNNGGTAKCKERIALRNTLLDRDFDFNSGFITKVTAENGSTASVEYTLSRDGSELVNMLVGLVKTKDGWAIDATTDK